MDLSIVLWLNGWVGRYPWLDGIVKALVSDYFAPALLGLSMFGMWFLGRTWAERSVSQRSVIKAAAAVGFANLAVLVINDYYFRPRPFVDHDLTLLFYRPTDSSFPANPAALSFALAFAVFQQRRLIGVALLAVAALWSLSRVYAGVFYPSDVGAGILIGVTSSYVATMVVWWLEPLPTLALRMARLFHLA